jgi:hypothetical protein
MDKRSGIGIRRAALMAAVVAGIGMAAAAGSATAADKGHGRDDAAAATTAQNCSVIQDWSYYRKCGDTGSEHEPAAEARHAREPQTPTDNEPVGAAAAPSRD